MKKERKIKTEENEIRNEETGRNGKDRTKDMKEEGMREMERNYTDLQKNSLALTNVERKITEVKQTALCMTGLSHLYPRDAIYIWTFVAKHEDLTQSEVQLSVLKGLLGHRDAATTVLVHHWARQMAEWCCFQSFLTIHFRNQP